jgi:hypothetical protein
MDPDGVVVNRLVSDGICKECTILATRTLLTYEDGKEAELNNGIFLHHIIASDPSKKVGEFLPWCPVKLETMTPFQRMHPINSIIVSSGSEHWTTWYTTLDGKFDSGFHTGKGPYQMSVEVVNYKPAPQKVFVTMDYDWVPAKVGTDALATLLSVSGKFRAVQMQSLLLI